MIITVSSLVSWVLLWEYWKKGMIQQCSLVLSTDLSRKIYTVSNQDLLRRFLFLFLSIPRLLTSGTYFQTEWKKTMGAIIERFGGFFPHEALCDEVTHSPLNGFTSVVLPYEYFGKLNLWFTPTKVWIMSCSISFLHIHEMCWNRTNLHKIHPIPWHMMCNIMGTNIVSLIWVMVSSHKLHLDLLRSIMWLSHLLTHASLPSMLPVPGLPTCQVPQTIFQGSTIARTFHQILCTSCVRF